MSARGAGAETAANDRAHDASAATAAAENSGSQQRELARGGALSFVGSATSAALGFVLTIVISRLFGAAHAGIIFQATGAFSVVLAFAKFGLDSTSNYLLPRVKIDDARQVRPVVYGFLIIAVAVSLVLVVALEIAAPFLWTDNPEVARSVRVIALFIPFGSVFLILAAILRALGSVRDYVMVANIGLPVLRPPFIAVVAVAGGAVVAASAAWALPMALMAVAAAVLVLRRLRRIEEVHGASERALPRARQVREVFGFAVPRTLSAGLEQAIVWFDVLLAGWLLNDHAAGIYAGASRFVQAGLLVDAALRVVVSPQLSALLHRGEMSRTRELYLTATMWLVLIGTPAYVFLGFFAPIFLGLLGPEFREGGTALAILAAGVAVTFLAGNIHSLLIMSGRSGWAAFNKLVVLAVNVGANLVLMPRYGIIGAAVAWSISMVLDAAMAAVEVKVFLGIALTAREVLAPVAVVLGTLGLACGAAVWLGGQNLWALLGALVVGGAAYAAACWRWRAPLRLGALGELVAAKSGKRS